MGLLTYFVAYLCETSERFIRGLSCICPLMSVCFPLPNMQTLHQKHTLPSVRPVFLSGVESSLYSSGKAVWLDWLEPQGK